MRLAGVTWWRGNYGSILQAYAMQHVMKNLNVDYEILDQYGALISGRHLVDHIKVLGLKGTLKKILWKYALPKVKVRNKTFSDFVSEYLIISKNQYLDRNLQEANKHYDGFLCGSDQVWNPELTKYDPLYWLQFADEDKLIFSYAPSIGVKDAPDEEKEIIRKNLEKFKGVSCREKSGTDFINSICPDKCITVLDPTMLLDKREWDRIIEPYSVKEKYVFAYFLRGKREDRKWVERFAKKKGCKVVSFPFLETEYIEHYDKTFGDIQIFDANPLQFISLIKNAEYVFTDSFHCTVFSIIYERQFWIFPKGGTHQSTRLEELTKMFKLENRFINSTLKIEDIDAIEYTESREILTVKRNVSMAFIHTVLFD